MYIENIRNTLKNLNEAEYTAFLIKLRRILFEQYSKNVKPSELKIRVQDFINGKTPKVDYFEAYLLTLDNFNEDGAILGLQSQKIKFFNTRDQLFQLLSEENKLHPVIKKYLSDEIIQQEIECLLINAVKYCEVPDKEVFLKNMKLLNQVLNMNKT